MTDHDRCWFCGKARVHHVPGPPTPATAKGPGAGQCADFKEPPTDREEILDEVFKLRRSNTEYKAESGRFHRALKEIQSIATGQTDEGNAS